MLTINSAKSSYNPNLFGPVGRLENKSTGKLFSFYAACLHAEKYYFIICMVKHLHCV